jgi:hypothetical protein
VQIYLKMAVFPEQNAFLKGCIYPRMWIKMSTLHGPEGQPPGSGKNTGEKRV